jgi:hypothetical protein
MSLHFKMNFTPSSGKELQSEFLWREPGLQAIALNRREKLALVVHH